MIDTDILHVAEQLEGIRESIPQTHGNPLIPRLFVLARTHIEIAELVLRKASEL